MLHAKTIRFIRKKHKTQPKNADTKKITAKLGISTSS